MVSTREIYENWQRGGKKDIVEKAYDKASWILKNHSVAPLEESQQKEIRAIIERFEGSQ